MGRIGADYAYGEAHCVVERSWGLSWSRSGIALWHRRELCGAGPLVGLRDGAPTPGARRGWIAAGVVAIGSIGLTTAGVVARPATPRWSARPLVSVAVPNATPFKDQRPAAPPKRRSAPAKPIAAADPTPAEHRLIATVPPAPASTGEEVDADGVVKREADAVAAALSSGTLQSWTEPDAGVQGFVVVGDAATADGQICRDVSVLRKSDAGSKVERYRRCTSEAVAG